MVIEDKFIKAVLTMYVVLDDNLRPPLESDVDQVVDNLKMDNNTATHLAESIDLYTDNQKIDKDGNIKPAINRVTIARFIGVYGNTRGHISHNNLQIIAEYLGFKSWDEVLRMKSLKAHILAKATFIKPEIVKSVYSPADKLFARDSIEYLLPMNMPAGYFVEIRYGDSEKHIKLRKVKDTGDCFVIVESDSKLVKKGWRITIPFFILNNNLVGTDIRMNDIKISSLYKSSGTVRSINVSMM